jgi:hypothetical protein
LGKPPRTGTSTEGGAPRLAVDPGLCARCVHLLMLTSPRSAFVRCGLADTDPRFPRYPRLPVLSCAGYEPREREDS